eukprot:jgi/Bigna1/130132/aug1.10_g4840
MLFPSTDVVPTMFRAIVPLVLVMLMVAANANQKGAGDDFCTDQERCAFPNEGGDDNATALSSIAGMSVRWQRFDGTDAFPGENMYMWTPSRSVGWVEDNNDGDADADEPVIPSPELCQQGSGGLGFGTYGLKLCIIHNNMTNVVTQMLVSAWDLADLHGIVGSLYVVVVVVVVGGGPRVFQIHGGNTDKNKYLNIPIAMLWYGSSCYFRSHEADELLNNQVLMENAVLYVRRILPTPAPAPHFSPPRLAIDETDGNQFAAGGAAKSSTKRNKFLVFSSVGNRCLEAVKNAWLSEPNVKIFDLVLVFYAATARNAVFRELRQYAQSIPGITLHVRKGYYSHIWVADDDLLMDTRAINRMFLTLAANPAIQIASPAFSSDSAGLWRFHDRHNPHFILRYTNFVECLGPVLSRAVLDNELFRRCLKATRTGYYLDSAFYPISGSSTSGMAIVDVAVCTHPERPEVEREMYKELADHEHGQDYKFFDQNGIAREIYWFREPEYFGGQRLPHIPRHITDETLGLPPREVLRLLIMGGYVNRSDKARRRIVLVTDSRALLTILKCIREWFTLCSLVANAPKNKHASRPCYQNGRADAAQMKQIIK